MLRLIIKYQQYKLPLFYNKRLLTLTTIFAKIVITFQLNLLWIRFSSVEEYNILLSFITGFTKLIIVCY